MIAHYVELTNGFNWGKFLLARFDRFEWDRRSAVADGSLLRRCGWTPRHIMVFDLQTGEGAMFVPSGLASADLKKHAIWVCPMFEVFLKWFYAHPEYHTDFTTIPAKLVLTDPETMKESALAGYRREGPVGEVYDKLEKAAKAGEGLTLSAEEICLLTSRRA